VCASTVDDFTRVVYKFAESPCVGFTVPIGDSCTFTWYGRDEEAFE
jgi:hypothetical protein